MSGSPGRHCPAFISRSTTLPTWAAVTAVSSSAGPAGGRPAARSTVTAGLQRADHRIRPPGDHDVLVLAPAVRGRTAGPGWWRFRPQPRVTSTAKVSRPSAAAAAAAEPAPTAAARCHRPRATRRTKLRGRAGAPAQATTPPGSPPARPRTAGSVSSNSSSARAIRQARNSSRNRDRPARNSNGRHRLASCSSRPSLGGQVCSGPNTTLITRRPHSRAATRRTPRVPRSANLPSA